MFSIAFYAYDVKLWKVSFFRAFGILCGYFFCELLGIIFHKCEYVHYFYVYQSNL
jgi:hypothetical protein